MQRHPISRSNRLDAPADYWHFLRGPASLAAPELLGCRLLVRRSSSGGAAEAVITEVEAYGANDPASHSFKGLTARNRHMFLNGGHAYIYLCYGLHLCLNVVTGAAGAGEAVLIRAVLPANQASLKFMRQNRLTALADRPGGLTDYHLLSGGPAKLTQALGIVKDDSGLDLLNGASPLRLLPRLKHLSGLPVSNTSRVGISRARHELLRWHYQATNVIDRLK